MRLQTVGFPSPNDLFELAGTAITVAGFFLAVVKPRAKVIETNPVNPAIRYIDYGANEMVEEKEYVFSWAHYLGAVLGRRVTLPKFSRDSVLKVFCKPPTSFKQPLSQECFETSTKGSHQYIHLVHRDYFEKNDMDRIYVQCNSSQGEAYKDNIRPIRRADGVLVENRNREEIRNYPLDLPEADFKDIPMLLRLGGQLMVPLERSAGEPPGPPNVIRVTIGKIGAMEGDIPGRVFIPVQTAQAAPTTTPS